ncbi:MAG: M20 family metallo-hydrolase [Bacteroidales bacterium]|nr:M20 family metallo-hydrolase [Bacteroidales bacterium]
MNNDSYFNEAVELLKQIIAIPSPSRNETKRADFLSAWMKKRDLKVNREQNNLWCTAPDYDPGRPTILLNSHMDTVKPVDGWEYEPFNPTTEGDRIYGLGSNDAGASLVSLIQTFRILSTIPQSYNLILGLTAEEEITGKNGIEALLPKLPPIALGVIGEPTNMHPAIAEKGLMVLDCIAHGKAGHAARNEGENAIYKAMCDIEWFKTHTFPLQSNFLGPVKMTVTQINAGTQHNVVPDACEFVVDVRINEFYSPESLYEEIRKQVKCEVKARSFRLNSSRIEMDHPVVTACLESGRVPYGSPTLSDQARMPFTTFKIGPGESSRSHTSNEFIILDEIREGINLYIKILDGLTLP